MDDLERVFRHLVATITAQFPKYLNQPFTVSELYQEILPYRHHRRALGLATNQAYELVLLQLLAGVRGFLVVDEPMRDALQKELASPNPDPAAFKRFADAQVSIAAEHRAPAASPVKTARPTAATLPESVPAAAPKPAPRPSVASVTPPTSRPSVRAILPQPGSTCRTCGEPLPPGRQISFCPHCGQSLTTIDCPACGSELEVGWRFCPACGRPAKEASGAPQSKDGSS